MTWQETTVARMLYLMHEQQAECDRTGEVNDERAAEIDRLRKELDDGEE